MDLMDFCEKNQNSFVIRFNKRFKIVIFCPVALISLFLCWTLPPPLLSFLRTRLLLKLIGYKHSDRLCGSDFHIQKETRKLVCQANE